MIGVEADGIRPYYIQAPKVSLQESDDSCLSACLIDLDVTFLLDPVNAGFHIEEIGEIRLIHPEGVGHEWCHRASEIHL